MVVPVQQRSDLRRSDLPSHAERVAAAAEAARNRQAARNADGSEKELPPLDSSVAAMGELTVQFAKALGSFFTSGLGGGPSNTTHNGIGPR